MVPLTARIERPQLYRGGSASTRDGPAPLSAPVLLSPQSGPCDLTGGADLGARLPAATFLHFLSLGRCSILGPGLGGSQSVIRAPLGDCSC